MKKNGQFSRYLPIEPDALRWGFHVTDYGYASVPAGSPYPHGRHPQSHHFDWDCGRTLDEFDLVYISHGRGSFESKPTGRAGIEAGQVFLLFPGVWHRYRPLKTTGWDEHWIGFNGAYARQLMESFFSPAQAVLTVGIDEPLIALIHSLGDLEAGSAFGCRQQMAARAVEALARVRTLAGSRKRTTRETTRKIHRARGLMLDSADSNLPSLARELGMSYSSFRQAFVAETGMPPGQYQLEIRINKAKDLLGSGALSVSEISEHLGFSSVFYFSRLFKSKTGCTPLAWRGKRAPCLGNT